MRKCLDVIEIVLSRPPAGGAAMLAALLLSATLHAHPGNDVGGTWFVEQSGSTLQLELVLQIGPHTTATLSPALAAGGSFTGAMSGELIDRLHERVSAGFHVKSTGGELKLKLDRPRSSVTASDTQLALHADLFYEIDLPPANGASVEITLEDRVFAPAEVAGLVYFVRGDAAATGMKLSDDGRSLTLTLTGTAATETPQRPPAAVAAPTTSPPEPSPEPDHALSLLRYLHLKKPGWATLLPALGMAILLGAAHALEPGHGKAMVAAYLVGSRGKVRDAVWLGLIVTFTHVIGVVALGVVVLLLSQYVVPATLYPILGVISGALVVGVGFWMLVRRSRAEGAVLVQDEDHQHSLLLTHHHAHDHDHAHGHGHPHHHHDPSRPITFGSLIAMGMAGGMAPCPGALVVLLASVALHRVALGLALIAAFSAGLALVLVAIGIAMVKASRLVERFDGSKRWISRLTLVSSAVVMVAGLAIMVHALMTAGIVTIRL